jgi:hypothetical protein
MSAGSKHLRTWEKMSGTPRKRGIAGFVSCSFPGERNIPQAGQQWLTPVILAIQEAEVRRIEFQSQPRQIVQETLS